MNSSYDNSSEKAVPPKLMPGCPFLGLRDDAETHFSTPSIGNYCHIVPNAEPIKTRHQYEYCLGNYSSCVVFIDAGKNGFPLDIRGDGFSATRPRIRNKTSQGQPQSEQHPTITTENRPKPRRNEDRKTSQPVNNVVVTPLAKLHDEAKVQFQSKASYKKDRLVWVILLLLASAILVVSLAGVMNRFDLLRTKTDQGIISAMTVTSIFQTTLTAEASPGLNVTQNNGVVVEASPTLEQIVAGSATDESPISEQVPTSTEPIIVSCDDTTGYIFEVLAGPDLSPRPGFLFQIDLTEPTVTATWAIKNTGGCDWSQIVLQDAESGEVVVPLLMSGGERIDQTSTENVISPNDEFEIVMGFRAVEATSVNRDWYFVVNGYQLPSQPHLIIKVENWIILGETTSTASPIPTKPSTGATKTPSGPNRITNTPVPRPTNTPSSRP